MSSIQVIAQQADAIFNEFMKVEPTISTVVSIFVPGAAPVVALVQPELLLLAPAIDSALQKLAAGANGDFAKAVLQMLMHVTDGMPNAASLAPSNASASASAAGGA